MRTILSSSEIVGAFKKGIRDLEVCATAEAAYDDGKSQLIVELDCFVRPADILAKEKHERTGWLPEKQTVREHVPRPEAADLARDIFHSWVHHVHDSLHAQHPA